MGFFAYGNVTYASKLPISKQLHGNGLTLTTT